MIHVQTTHLLVVSCLMLTPLTIADTLTFDIGGRSETSGARNYLTMFGSAGSTSTTGTVTDTVGGETFTATFTLSVGSSDASPVIAYRGTTTANNFIGVGSQNGIAEMQSVYADQVTITFTSIDNPAVQFNGFTKLTGGNAAVTERAVVNSIATVGGLKTGDMIDLTSTPFSLAQSLTVQAAADSGGGASSFDIGELGLRFSNVDTTPPAAPTNFSVVTKNSSITLNWNNNSEGDFASYQVYRKIGTGAFALIQTNTSITASGYIDYGFGTTQDYVYRVTAKDDNGNESLASEITVTATTPSGTLDFSPVDPASRPNIILIMSDDQGWGDTGYNGSTQVGMTPNMDEMAADGFVLNRFYAAAPVCSPTRASVISGRNPVRSKVTNHGRYMRSHQEMTLPEALKTAGYVTGFFGKAHICSVQVDSPVNPTSMGFDEWVIGANYFDNNPYLSRNGAIERFDGSPVSTNPNASTSNKGSVAVTDETINFLEAHKSSGNPMFVMLWPPAPHDPFNEQSVNNPPNITNGYFKETFLFDEQVGRIRQWLRDNNLEQNTIVWVMSDNGGLNLGTTGGRDKKGDLWEGGLRVPGIIEWPARNIKGSTNIPAVTSDIYPTLLNLVGVSVESQTPLDGVDIKGLIEGTQTSRPAIGFWDELQAGEGTFSDTILSNILTKQLNGDPLPHDAARIKKDVDEFPQFSETTLAGNSSWLDWPWKLHRRGGTTYELYNLETDPLEAYDLAGNPAEATRLNAMTLALHAWQESAIRSLNGADYGNIPAWLPFNTTMGLEALDANSSKRGDLFNFANNTSHWVTGKHNKALQLDGSDDTLEIANSHWFAPVGANARTVSAWVKATGAGIISSWGDGSINGANWEISFDVGGRLHLDVSGGSITGTTVLNDGTWHHIAVVLPNDGSPNVTEVVLYVDGAAETPSGSAARAIATSNSAVTIGGARAGGAITVDEFRIAPSALTPAEVLAQFAATAQAESAWHYQYYGVEGPINWVADTDEDGFDTLSEYAFGMNPLVRESDLLPVLESSFNNVSQKLEVTFTRRKLGTHTLTYNAQFSNDLSTWTRPFSIKSVVDHPTLDSSRFEQLTLESDDTLSTEPRLFMRVELLP